MLLFIGVMTIHAYNLEIYGIDSNDDSVLAVLETFLRSFAEGICVPFFFVISGFLFFRNFKMSMLFDKYRSRAKSIVLPYVVWTTLYYLFFVCIFRVPAIANVMNSKGEVSLGIGAYIRYVWEGYYTFWFLRVLIWMILLTPILYLLLKRRKYYWPEPMLILLLLIGLGIINIPKVNLNIYYVLGAYLGMNFKELPNKENKIASIVAAVCFPFLVILGGTYAGRLWYNCLFFAVIWLAMNLFDFSHDVRWWVKCTFFYYCAHDMVLESVEKLILIIGGRSNLMAFLDYLLAPVITLLILICAAWVLRRWMKPIWQVLSGGRAGEGGKCHAGAAAGIAELRNTQ